MSAFSLVVNYFYHAWENMKQRCSNIQGPAYGHYGGRGVQVCSRWLTFSNFYADMGDLPTPNHTLERVDVNGDYEPDNCVWATWKQQHNNTRKTHRLTAFGENKSLTLWLDDYRCVVSRRTLYRRLGQGMSVERALTKPLLTRAQAQSRSVIAKMLRKRNCCYDE